MFPSFAASKGLPLSHDQAGNPNFFSYGYSPVTNDNETNQFDFDDILNNYQSVIDQPTYQDCSNPLNFGAHICTSYKQDQALQEMTTTDTRNDQEYSSLDFPAYFSTDEQNMDFRDTITAGCRSQSSDNCINISFKPLPNNFHIEEVKRERLHAGLKVALRKRTNLEVVDDGYKWRKYGKKKVKSSPHPRNYFKCSTAGCNVKKQIERDRDDSNYVITTYDGVHHHQGSS